MLKAGALFSRKVDLKDSLTHPGIVPSLPPDVVLLVVSLLSISPSRLNRKSLVEGSVLVLLSMITKSQWPPSTTVRWLSIRCPQGQGPDSTFHTCGSNSRQDGPILYMRALRLARSWQCTSVGTVRAGQSALDLQALSPFPQGAVSVLAIWWVHSCFIIYSYGSERADWVLKGDASQC